MAEEASLTSIMHKLGMMEGEQRIRHEALTNSLELIRTEMQRIERAAQEQVLRLEQSANNRFTAQEMRIIALEAEDKNIYRQSALSGGLSAALITGFVELMKQI
jgi:hypothetical protein